MSLLKSNLAVASGTAMSRLTGMIRTATLGVVIGQGGLTDAYNQANSTPNLIYELLLGGVLSASLVPLFTRLHEENDREGTAEVFSVTTAALALLTTIAVIAAPLIFRMYSWMTSTEIDADQYHRVGTLLARLFLLQVLFYGVNALCTAYLNARGRYFAAAWVPALSNVVIIISLLMVPATVDHKVPVLTDVLYNGSLRWTLGLGATLGVAVMALALLPSMVRVNAPLTFRFTLDSPAIRRLRTLSGWALGYVVANQVAILVVQNLTRAGTGSQDAYTKAFTLFVLPHGLLAMSIATTFMPEMTRAVMSRDRGRFIERSSMSIRLVAMLTIPAGFGLFALRRSIIAACFQWGRFDTAGTLRTSRALAGFALGLGAFSLYLIVLRAFYAHHDARTPFVINVVENLINIVLAFALYQRYGVLGLGAAFAVAYVLSAVLGLQVLTYKLPGYPLAPIWDALWKVLLASAVMAEVAWLVSEQVGGVARGAAVTRALTGSLVGVVVYVVVLATLGMPELAELRTRARRIIGR